MGPRRCEAETRACLNSPHKIFGPKSTPANGGHNSPWFPVNLDRPPLPSGVDNSSAWGSFSSPPEGLWERQKSQLPQFPNRSDQVAAQGATSAPRKMFRGSPYFFSLSPCHRWSPGAPACSMRLPGSSSSQFCFKGVASL